MDHVWFVLLQILRFLGVLGNSPDPHAVPQIMIRHVLFILLFPQLQLLH